MDSVLDNKWYFLVGAEVSFWVLTAAFLALRYLFKLERAGFVVLALIALDTALVVGLGVLDYRRTGELAAYQVVAAAVVVYGLVYGRHDLRRLDVYLKGKVEGSEATPPRVDVAKGYRRGWYTHFAVFVVGQAALFAAGAAWFNPLPDGGPASGVSGLTDASRTWTIIFVVDTIWSLSYTVFPGRAGDGASDRGRGPWAR